MKKIFLLLTIMFHCMYATPNQIDLSEQNFEIGHQLRFFEDTSSTMDYESVKALSENSFTPLEKKIDAQYFTNSSFWYKFEVQNKEQTPLDRIIYFGVPWLDSVNIFVQDQDRQLSTYKGGDTYPFDNREINNHLINFNHHFEPGVSTVYVKVKTRDPFVVSISIVDTFTFLTKTGEEAIVTSFIYGVIIAMLLYNFVLFLNIKVKAYFFYVLYLSAFIVAHASYNCHTFKWFLFDYPDIQNWMESTTIFIFAITGLLFAQSFLNLKEYFPRLYQLNKTFIRSYVLIMLVTALFGYHVHIIFSIGLTVIFSVYLFALAFYTLIRGNRYSRFFLLGTTAGLLGTSTTALTVMAFIPYSDFGFHALDYGMVLDSILLSIALADRLKIIQEDKQNAEYEAIQAKKETKAKEEFLSNMSHEIRTPMNAIVGFVDILIKKIKDEEHLKYLNIISSSSKNLLHLINDILDLSKIQSGKLVIDKYLFNPKYEIEQVYKLFKVTAEEKSINMFCDFDSNIPKVLEGDMLRINQILFNFLSNALKFTSENKSININVEYKNKNLIISVIDEGIGISKDVQENIFQAFEQADSSTSRKFGGTGLGLSIATKLAKLMEGTIELKSKEGIGSTFCISIPLDVVKNVPSEDTLLDTESSSRPKYKGKILVVEDNKTNQLLIEILLDEYNLTYVIANDGIEAVSTFSCDTFDLVLMDQSMPRMSGTEAFKEIRHYENINGLQATPVVILTANVMEEDRKYFSEIGMDDFLAKPIDTNELERVFSRFL